MGEELGRHSIPLGGREARVLDSISQRVSRGWFGIPFALRAVVGALVLGAAAGQLILWWGEHQILSTYIAFAPGGMESAGVPRSEIQRAMERGAAKSLKTLLDKYDTYCDGHIHEAAQRRIDCERIHRMDSEPVPNN